MQPDVERLFHELADLTPQERSGYYLEHDVNEQTRLEVERLLSFDRETPIVGAAAGVVAEALLRDDDSFNVGLRCGPYRLDDVIGRGGMGTVYRAERVDGEITQRAAVKLLRIVGSGPAWRERFARERQFLASLSHDSIVRLLDAGHTEDGQPYLAMELVEGLPIDQYAGAANASSKGIRHLLEVFLRVCDGVAHAHRNLVIHRDLKPSNILVDEAGNPKLLDFGIAKLTEDAADPTQTADRLLSPLYASPEQFTGARQTTVSDVYSLGAILYRILTGRSPHESAEGGFAGEILLGELKIRAPREVNRSLPLDLSYVLMRALRRDPDERYSSVTELSQDLQCFLNNQPVSARPDSLLYRAGRFIRRNSIAVATAATVAIALAATSAVAIRESINARTRFNQLRKVARTVLFEFNDELDRVPGTTRAKALLMATSREYLDNLARSAGNDHSLLLELAEAYERLASLQGGAAAGNLGQHIDALASRRAALEIRRRINARNPQEEALFVNSLAATSDLLRNLGQLSEALTVGREALAKASGLLKNEDSQILFARITAHQALSRVLIDLNRMEEAESELGRAEKLVPLNLPAAFRLRVNTLKIDHGDVLQNLGRVPEAVALLEQAERDAARWIEEAPQGAPLARLLRHRQTLYAGLAELHYTPTAPSLEQPEMALEFRGKLCKGWEHLLSLDPGYGEARSGLAVCESETSSVLLKLDPGKAVDLARQGLRTFQAIEPANPNASHVYRSARASTRLAFALLAAGRAGEALEQLQPSLKKHRDLLVGNKDNPRYRISLTWTLIALGQAEETLGRQKNARAALEEAVRLSEPLAAGNLMYLRIAADAHQVYSRLLPQSERCLPLRRAGQLWNGWKGPPSAWVEKHRQHANQLIAACSF